MSRPLRLIILAAALLALPLPAAAATITIGGKNFTEQYLLVSMARLLLEKAGHTVETRTGVGSTIARRSLESGQIDCYYEYTGTAYTVYHHQSDPEVMRDPQRVYRWVKERDAAQGLIWLEPVRFNNTYTLIMQEKRAAALGIASIGDLAERVKAHPDELLFGMGAEFWERPDGFKTVMRTYGFRVPPARLRKMSVGLTYRALQQGQVDVAVGFATDGRIAAFNFVSLEDDRQVFPVYNPAPVVRSEALARLPELPQILAPLAERLNTEVIRRLNAAVDVDHIDALSVARQWLEQEGLL